MDKNNLQPGDETFESSDGVVSFAKDDKTLTVDARGLSGRALPAGQSRRDTAYQIASDILGCWTEH